ncbi:MAG: pyridoxamine 5'-phosphate oxidase family protein [Candidatus Thorarchaeota archaeon]|jgi:nitroimidazol reductase NimA-like FMN-containing flavoprotein (pyridoxamine 5'-phosphate oxidase superfamily)
MRGIRRKEKAIEDKDEIISIIRNAKYITVAMSVDDEPYLVTLSHGYDVENYCIYFHCAHEGKKIDILKKNNIVWGQALQDYGYADGSCDHLYATAQFRGKVSFVGDLEEKRHALVTMIRALEPDPEKVIQEQVTEKSAKDVNIGRIDIEFMSGKKAKEIIISGMS